MWLSLEVYSSHWRSAALEYSAGRCKACAQSRYVVVGCDGPPTAAQTGQLSNSLASRFVRWQCCGCDAHTAGRCKACAQSRYVVVGCDSPPTAAQTGQQLSNSLASRFSHWQCCGYRGRQCGSLQGM